MLPLLKSLFCILLNVSCVYLFQRKRQEKSLSMLGKKASFAVGCYGINPSRKEDVYAWLFKYLLTDFAGA